MRLVFNSLLTVVALRISLGIVSPASTVPSDSYWGTVDFTSEVIYWKLPVFVIVASVVSARVLALQWSFPLSFRFV